MSNLLSSLGSNNDYREVDFGEEIGSVEGATIVRRVKVSTRIVAYDDDGTEPVSYTHLRDHETDS